KQGSGTFGDDSGRPESAGDDELIASSVPRIAADHLGAGLEHDDTGVEAQGRYCFAQKRTPASPGVNQGPQTLRPRQGEHEARYAGTRAEIDRPARCVGRSCKPQGMLEGLFDGTG